jgi:acetyl esterase
MERDPQLAVALAQTSDIERRAGVSGADLTAQRQRASSVRAYWNQGGPVMAAVEPRRLPGPTRDVPVVIYRPVATTAPSPAFLFLHGGGFQLGNEWANDRQMREIASQWRGIVISVDYLHAPEHPFPSAVEEIAAVLRWLHGAGDTLGIDPARIAFGGTSAGASVAFGAAVEIGPVAWLQAAVSIVGAFDFDAASPSMQQYGGGELFPARAMVAPMLASYAPASLHDDPRVALLKADPACFPPTFLAAAEYDVFKDASIQMATRLDAAGRLHALTVYPRMAHLFFGFSRTVDQAARCVGDVARFLSERLPASP